MAGMHCLLYVLMFSFFLFASSSSSSIYLFIYWWLLSFYLIAFQLIRFHFIPFRFWILSFVLFGFFFKVVIMVFRLLFLISSLRFRSVYFRHFHRFHRAIETKHLVTNRSSHWCDVTKLLEMYTFVSARLWSLTTFIMFNGFNPMPLFSREFCVCR